MASSARIPLHPYLTTSKRTFRKYTLCFSPFSSLFLFAFYIYLQSKWKVNGFQWAPLSGMFEACQWYVRMSNYTIHCSRTTRFVLYNAQRLLTVGGIVWLLVMGAFCSLVAQLYKLYSYPANPTSVSTEDKLKPRIVQSAAGALPTAGIQWKGRKDWGMRVL